MELPKEYEWAIRVASYDAGPDGRLRLSNLLKLQQEAGERHLRDAGLGYQTLYDCGVVFVLTRASGVIHRAPLFGEEVRLLTWHRNNKGTRFFRCYQFLDDSGRPLIESVSAFALVDPQAHKPLRPTVFEEMGIGQNPEHINGCPDPERLRLPDGLVPQGERRIRWSDTDVNGHLNNTNYADILCDLLPGGMKGRRITGFSIGYQKEAREGDVLAVSATEQDGAIWMRAQRQTDDGEMTPCFEAKLTYVPEG